MRIGTAFILWQFDADGQLLETAAIYTSSGGV
jgi:hypothetical protein